MSETVIQCQLHGYWTALELCPRCTNWKTCIQPPKEQRKELEAYVKWEKANFAKKLRENLNISNYKKGVKKSKTFTIVGTDKDGKRVRITLKLLK